MNLAPNQSALGLHESDEGETLVDILPYGALGLPQGSLYCTRRKTPPRRGFSGRIADVGWIRIINWTQGLIVNRITGRTTLGICQGIII